MSVQDNSSRQPLLPAEHDEDSHIYYVNAAAAAAAAGAASPPAGEGTAMLADARLQPLPQSMQAPKAPRRDLLAFFIFGGWLPCMYSASQEAFRWRIYLFAA